MRTVPFETEAPVLFTGDVGGVRIGGAPVVPPCPPPDIQIEDWLESIAVLRKSPANILFLTHYGRFEDKESHLNTLETVLQEWAEWMKPHVAQQRPQQEVIPEFEDFVAINLRKAGASDSDLLKYSKANPAFMSVAGLYRYWKKKWKE